MRHGSTYVVSAQSTASILEGPASGTLAHEFLLVLLLGSRQLLFKLRNECLIHILDRAYEREGI